MWNYCAATFSSRFFGMPFGMIGMFMLIGLVFCAVCFFRRRPPTYHCNRDREDTLKILQTRLAKGEISIEEFNKLKSYL